jgi:hypothetical protein
MLSQLSVFAHQIENRAFHLLCDPNSPLSHVKEALAQFMKHVGNLEDQIKANAEAQAKIDVDAKSAEQTKIEEPVLPVSDEVKQE